jgi:hypothetical protein
MRTDSDLMKAVNSNDINTIIKILGLESFGHGIRHEINQDVLDRFKIAGLSKDDIKKIKSNLKDKVSSLNSAEIIGMINTEEDGQQAQSEAVINVMSSLERDIFAPQTSMSLEYVGDEIKLTLINGISELLLLPDQVISLLESPNKSVVLSNFVKAVGKYSSGTSFKLIGTLEPEISSFITSLRHEGMQVCDPEGHDMGYCFFHVEIKRLLLYYTVFKREQAERAKFNHLHNNTQFHPVDDIT